MPEATPTTVTIILGSTPFTLRPTVERMRVLNRLAGGFTPLFRAVANFDGDTMALVIAAGAGVREKPVEDLTRAVYEAGLEDLVDDVTRFLTLCTSGGRDAAVVRPKAAGDAGTGKAPEVNVLGDGAAPEKGTAEAETLTSRESTAA